jgi:hypothetical protein
MNYTTLSTSFYDPILARMLNADPGIYPAEQRESGIPDPTSAQDFYRQTQTESLILIQPEVMFHMKNMGWVGVINVKKIGDVTSAAFFDASTGKFLGWHGSYIKGVPNNNTFQFQHFLNQ